MEGGLISEIHDDAEQISISMSVHNGETGVIIGPDESTGSDTEEKNSGNLDDIIGVVYCYNKTKGECWSNQTIWQAVEDDFPIFLQSQMPSPSPSLTPLPSVDPIRSPSKSITKTSKPSNSLARLGLLTPSIFQSPRA